MIVADFRFISKASPGSCNSQLTGFALFICIMPEGDTKKGIKLTKSEHFAVIFAKIMHR